MGIFKKLFKGKEALKQDLSDKQQPGGLFIIHLLFEEKCGMPDREYMKSVMDKHMGENELFTYNETTAGFSAKKYTAEFSDGAVPPMLTGMGCTEITDWQPDTIDGIRDGGLCRDIQWKCQFENSLIQPVRPVIDVHMGELASGGRK